MDAAQLWGCPSAAQHRRQEGRLQAAHLRAQHAQLVIPLGTLSLEGRPLVGGVGGGLQQALHREKGREAGGWPAVGLA